MRTPTRLPLARYQGLLWSVAVTVAGRPRTFLLDLGAGVTALDTTLVAELAPADRGACTGRRMSGEEVHLRLHEGVELRLGELTLAPDRIASLDIASLLPAGWPPVHGTLALDVLERVPFTLDLAGDEIVLETAASCEERISQGALLDVRLHRQIPGVSLDVMAAVRAPDGDLWFELDNGNAGPVVLSPASRERLGIAPDGGEVTLHVAGLGEVVTDAVVAPIIHDGNLGRTLLERLVLTFDLANERVSATRRAD